MRYQQLADPEVQVQAMFFTGENRTETKSFVDRPIVIRNGRFFIGTGYVTANHWVLKHADDTIVALSDDEFKRQYKPI